MYLRQPAEIPVMQNNKCECFEGVFGSIDGSHIPIVPQFEDEDRWKVERLIIKNFSTFDMLNEETVLKDVLELLLFKKEKKRKTII